MHLAMEAVDQKLLLKPNQFLRRRAVGCDPDRILRPKRLPEHLLLLHLLDQTCASFCDHGCALTSSSQDRRKAQLRPLRCLLLVVYHGP